MPKQLPIDTYFPFLTSTEIGAYLIPETSSIIQECRDCLKLRDHAELTKARERLTKWQESAVSKSQHNIDAPILKETMGSFLGFDSLINTILRLDNQANFKKYEYMALLALLEADVLFHHIHENFPNNLLVQTSSIKIIRFHTALRLLRMVSAAPIAKQRTLKPVFEALKSFQGKETVDKRHVPLRKAYDRIITEYWDDIIALLKTANKNKVAHLIFTEFLTEDERDLFPTYKKFKNLYATENGGMQPSVGQVLGFVKHKGKRFSPIYNIADEWL